MCGLFGFFGARPEPGVLALAAQHSARRGPDAWGVLDADGLKRGLLRLDASSLSNASGPLIMGHCRLATVLGTGRDLTAVQPLTRDGMAISHNGAVYNLSALGLRLRTKNDSEAWLALMLTYEGPLDQRVIAASSRIDHHGYYALAAHYKGKIVLATRQMPLFINERSEGVYWSSVSPCADWRRIEGVYHA